MPLKIVLLGTGEFALPAFQALIESRHHVVAVFTQPDRTGKGHHRHVNLVKELALQHQVPVFQPDRVNRPEVLEQLSSLQADLFIVAAYGQILKPAFLSIPRLGAFNLHGSLLPRHRGAAPVQYSIWKGDVRAGVTIFQIEPALDSGPMVGRVETEIGPQETSGDLMLRLAELCVPLTIDVVDQLEQGQAHFEPQDPQQVTLAPKVRKEQGLIDWQRNPSEIDCHVRAMQPWPRASTWLLRRDHEPLRCLILNVLADSHAEKAGEPERTSVAETISKAHAGASPGMPGDAMEVGGKLVVLTGDGPLQILKIQPEGKKAMDAAAFLNGHPLPAGSRFGNLP